MHRLCTQKSTGKFISYQSGGKDHDGEDNDIESMRLNTLKENAIKAGYKENDIEVSWITDQELAVIESELNQPSPEKLEQMEKEILIKDKMIEMAEAELKKEGKLTESGSIKKGIDK